MVPRSGTPSAKGEKLSTVNVTVWVLASMTSPATFSQWLWSTKCHAISSDSGVPFSMVGS